MVYILVSRTVEAFDLKMPSVLRLAQRCYRDANDSPLYYAIQQYTTGNLHHVLDTSQYFVTDLNSHISHIATIIVLALYARKSRFG